jgi:transmembrane sensor
MKTHPDPVPPADDRTIVEQAADWLIRLRDTKPAAGDPYRDPEVRHRAFFEWLTCSPAHLRAFMELMELERRVRRLDAGAFSGIQRLIESAPPAVVDYPPPRAQALATRAKVPPVYRGTAVKIGLVATASVTIIAFLTVFSGKKAEVYATRIGEQRQYSLPDGSTLRLNTNSAVEVDFSTHARDIRLGRGEALFSVKDDAQRPFTVSFEGGRARVLGTDFDVRKEQTVTQVSVLTGAVRVTTLPNRNRLASGPKASDQPEKRAEVTPTEVTLTAGKTIEISPDSAIKVVAGNVDDALAWRQNRLIFHNARLVDVVEEFNRYNQVQIRVEGATAQDIRLTGMFETGGYRDILQFARKTTSLAVTQKGSDWVIRAR